jgi:hypothetical protein
MNSKMNLRYIDQGSDCSITWYFSRSSVSFFHRSVDARSESESNRRAHARVRGDTMNDREVVVRCVVVVFYLARTFPGGQPSRVHKPALDPHAAPLYKEVRGFQGDAKGEDRKGAGKPSFCVVGRRWQALSYSGLGKVSTVACAYALFQRERSELRSFPSDFSLPLDGGYTACREEQPRLWPSPPALPSCEILLR